MQLVLAAGLSLLSVVHVALMSPFSFVNVPLTELSSSYVILKDPSSLNV